MAASLKEQIAAPEKRNAVIADALSVLDAEVNDKSGLTGIAVKTAFKVVKGVQPGFIRSVVDKLLGEFVEKMEPYYQRALEQGLSPGGLLEKERSSVAGALLSVTDRRVEGSQDLVAKTYQKLRPAAQKHVEAAAPRLAGLLDRHFAQS
jgi:hypothetical protein